MGLHVYRTQNQRCCTTPSGSNICAVTCFYKHLNPSDSVIIEFELSEISHLKNYRFFMPTVNVGIQNDT